MTRLALLCALVAACGGISINDLKSSEIDALCDRLVRCGQVASKQECIDLYDRVFSDAQLKAGVGNGSITYDDGKAGDCVDALRGESCDDASKDARVLPQACKDAVHGNRKQGDPCYFGAQCTSQKCTPPTGTCTMTCCAGTCAADPPAPAAIGQSCMTAACVDGSYCDATQTCVALIAANAACTSSTQCTYGTLCAGASTTALACTPTPKAGDPCANEGGSFPTCDTIGLACDATNHCVALLDKGATCDPNANLCKGDLMCDATAHTCQQRPGTGQPCTTVCAEPDTCKIDTTTGAGTCVAPLANGMQCQSSNDCASTYCDQSKAPAVCADKTVCS
jgi:hypothetical protein